MNRYNGTTPSRAKLLLRRSELGRRREDSFVIFKENVLLCLKVLIETRDII